ncbi:MAG: hypothetical protein WCV56_08200 [Candidatus Omnitrophota bacterium]
MRKIFTTVLVVVLAVVLVLSVVKDPLAKFSVEKGVEMVTGLRLEIADLNIGILKTLVGIKDLKLFNPAGFEDEIMMDMPEIYVDYNLPAIVMGNIHLRTVRLNMNEFLVVKNAKGELNLNSLKVVKEEKTEKKPAPAEKAKAPEIQIDVLELKVGKVIYKDYSKGGKPIVQEFNLNLNERYTDINDPNKLVSLIVVQALRNTTIARLANFDLKGLEGTISDTLATADKLVGTAQGVVAGAGGAATQITQTAQDAAKETVETVQKTADDLQKLFQDPFGAKEE